MSKPTRYERIKGRRRRGGGGEGVGPGANREEESVKLEEETAGKRDKRRSEEGELE